MDLKAIQNLIDVISASPPTLFVLCGLPYSGKTYVARQILAATECRYVSIDEILERLGYDWEANRLPDADGWKNVFQISYDESDHALQGGKSVLYDSTNHTKASRDVLREVAKKAGSDARIIFLDTPADVVRGRWERNKTTRERFVLSQALLEQTINALERPMVDEDVITLK